MTDTVLASAAYLHFMGQKFQTFIPAPPRIDGIRWFSKHATEEFPKDQFFVFALSPIRYENNLLKNTPRRFSFRKTAGEVLEFLQNTPMHERCLEEVIKPDTHHRFYLDLERDNVDPDVVEHYKHVSLTCLLPMLCEFLSSFLNRPVTLDQWAVMFACSATKFSAHATLVDYYFETRAESELLALAMESFFYGVEDETFKTWYVFHENEKRKTVVDYAVYHKGARNMRMLSAIKISAKGSAPAKYEELRPLLPHDPTRPLTDYLVTAVTRKVHKIQFSEEKIKEIRTDYLKIPVRDRSKRSVALKCNAQARHTEVVDTVNNGTTRDVFLNLMQKRLLEVTPLAEFQRMKQVAQKLALDLCDLLHPDNVRSFQQQLGPGEICKLQTRANVIKDGTVVLRKDGRPQRMCFWSYSVHEGVCQHGTHSVDISILCDFSAKYFCFACKNDGYIIRSPFSSNTIRPKFYNSGPPPEFEGLNLRYINYADGQNPSLYMQEIQKLPDGNLVGSPRTIFLHGSMGSGKSYTTSKFISDSGVKRILSITFRTMLAKSNARVFNLEYYNNGFFTQGDLALLERLAIQLDSIERIAELEEIDGRVVRKFAVFDLVILDESESILNHISSSTLEGRKNRIFSFLEYITRFAKTVIVADADLGERSFAYIENTRRDSHIEFHRNPFVLKHTEYIDYKFKHRWVEQLVSEIFTRNKKIFVVSNSKGQLYHLEDRIRSEQARRGIEDYDFVKVLSSDMTGPEREAMAESVNIEWKRYQVLMISPVVGAGISFDEKHYDEAFVFATPRSCVPREVCQLLGRVRNLLNGKVHVYIQPRRGSASDVKPTKKLQKRLRRRQNDAILDFSGYNEEEETFTFVERSESLMNKILLLNENEKKKGREEFRCGFIETLQRNNPNLNYHFDVSGSFREEMRFEEEYNDFREQNEGFNAGLVSSQIDTSVIDMNVAKRRNQAGLLASDVPEIQENIVPLIIYEDTKSVLGLQRALTDEEKKYLENYLLVFGSEPCALKNKITDFMAFFVFTAEETFHTYDKVNIDPLFIGIDGQYQKVKTNIALSAEHFRATVNEWIHEIFHLAGHSDNCNFHNHLMRERLYTQEAQDFLKKQVPLLQQRFPEFPSLKKEPKYKKKLDLHIVADGCTIRSFANFITKHVLHVGELEKSKTCENHEKCKASHPNRFLLDVMRKISLRNLWIDNNMDVFEREKAKIQDYVLPPLMEPFDQLVATTDASVFTEQIDRMKIKESLQFEKLQRSKGSMEAKFDLEWKRTTDFFLEQDVYALDSSGSFSVPGDDFARTILEAPYKARTKRFISDVREEMDQKRRKLFDELS